jgi:adenosine 3'-phospho 5'-phosphosulfate transporter B3
MIGHELALESLSTAYKSFPHLATSITLFQFGFCVLLPLLVSQACAGGNVMQSFPRSIKEMLIYIKLSAIVYGATAFATMSLNYEGVTYVTKVVFKSAKLIPTMILGMVMDTRAERAGISLKKLKYSIWEYASAFLLCIGAAGFCMSPRDSGEVEIDGTKNLQEDTQELSDGQMNGGHWIGITLLAISVFCDALVPNVQHQLLNGIGGAPSIPQRSKTEDDELDMQSLMGKEAAIEHETPKKQQHVASTGLSSEALMVNTNSIGFSLLLLSTIIRFSFLQIMSFTLANPQFLLLNLTVGLGLGTAVLSYTELIRRSGPAIAVAVATRK